MKDRSPGAYESLTNKLGMFNATFCHVDLMRINFANADDVKKEITALFDPCQIDTLVVDLENVSVGTDGFRALLELQKTFRENGCEIVLLDLSKSSKRNLKVCGLSPFFQQFSSNN